MYKLKSVPHDSDHPQERVYCLFFYKIRLGRVWVEFDVRHIFTYHQCENLYTLKPDDRRRHFELLLTDWHVNRIKDIYAGEPHKMAYLTAAEKQAELHEIEGDK
jgi:hypothetical protein